MKNIHKGLWLVVILGLAIVSDWMLPVYGFTEERATWIWRGFQWGVGVTSLFAILVLLVQSGIYAHSNQPTNPTKWLDDQPDDQPTRGYELEDGQPTPLLITIEEPPPGLAEEAARLSDEVKIAVQYFAREGSYKEAGKRLGKNPETIRKNCIKAREVAPNWYAHQVKE